MNNVQDKIALLDMIFEDDVLPDDGNAFSLRTLKEVAPYLQATPGVGSQIPAEPQLWSDVRPILVALTSNDADSHENPSELRKESEEHETTMM